MNKELFEPTKLTRFQIESLARLFAQKTNFVACDENGKKRSDIFKYISSLGGQIKYSSDVYDRNGGSIEVKGKKDFVIYLSRFTSPKRDVFTIAHELGHFVLHSRLGSIRINAQRGNEDTLSEREANTFASEFLMPEELLRKKYNNNLLELANDFNVSMSAMLYRCRVLGLYNER